MSVNDEQVVIKAILCEQNNQKFYVANIKSRMLKKMCFITRRGEDEGGFQRLLSEGRAKSIMGYLDDEKGVIPTPLILSAQENIDISYDKRGGKLTFSENEKGFLIIDGQHRLYGLNLANNEYEMPVVIFTGLSSVREVNLFIDINTTQKGVPAALLVDLKEMAGKETPIEARQRELFEWVNTTAPMAGQLSSTTGGRGKISRKAFNDATVKLYESRFFKNQDDSTIAKSLTNYLMAVEKAFILSNDKEARLNKTINFNAIMNIYITVVDRCIAEYNNLKVDSFSEILQAISTISYSTYKGTNKQTLAALTKELKSKIEKKVKITEEMF